MSWTLLDIRNSVRSLIARPSTTQITDAALNTRINDFYTRDFFRDVQLEAVRGIFSQQLSVLDSGDYAIDNAYVTFEDVAFINGRRIHLTFDKEFFGMQYPDDEDFQDDPLLAIGTTSEAAVKTGDFYYTIDGYGYHTTGSELALNGSNLPTGKWGAWLVEIQTDGTLVIAGASGNSTGYDSPGLAVEGLPDTTTARACCGYVVVQNASGADFVPGTTLLSAAGITDYYVDGKPDNRNEPQMALIYGRVLYIRPKPKDYFIFKCNCMQKPTVLTLDTDAPLNEDWGQAIAYGTAIKYLGPSDNGETGKSLPGLYDREIELIQLDYFRHLGRREIARSF